MLVTAGSGTSANNTAKPDAGATMFRSQPKFSDARSKPRFDDNSALHRQYHSNAYQIIQDAETVRHLLTSTCRTC